MNRVQLGKGAEGFVDNLAMFFSFLRHELAEVIAGAYEAKRVEDGVRMCGSKFENGDACRVFGIGHRDHRTTIGSIRQGPRQARV